MARNMYPDDHVTSTYGDGRLWHRIHPIPQCSEAYGPTHTAILKKPRFRHPHIPLPVSLTVKSAALPADVALLKKELSLFKTLAGCSSICTCFGEEITYGGDIDKGFVPIHNILLEHSYVNLGSLIQDRSDLSESKVRRITRDILEGVSFLHGRGYVHCGLFPEILLVFDKGGRVLAKIGDLGLVKLARRAGEKKRKVKTSGYLRRNLRYFAPEVVGEKVQEGPADVWAVGCMVIEMLTGKSMWDGKKDKEVEEGLLRIGKGGKGVMIPNGVSEEAKCFLMRCLDWKASRRWTAMMLLDHPFVATVSGESKGEF